MSGYSIVDIPGWENLPLSSADRADVDARLVTLAHETISEEMPRDSATPFRREMHKHLTRIVDQARSSGAGLICLPTRRIGETAVPASYTVSEWRDAEPVEADPATFLRVLAEHSTGAVKLVDLDGQPALREEEIEAADPAADPLALYAARRVSYTVASPADPRGWVLFTFATIGNGSPTGPLADALVNLFDAQLSTLRWSEE
jgi:hypothetical protein